MSKECPKCGEYAEDGAEFCGACGRTITECPSCKVFTKKGFACCGVCGRSLSESDDEDRPPEKKPVPAKIEVIPDNSAKVCTRCTEFAERGATFCGACGSPIKECPRCKEYDTKGAAFCGVCGRTLKQSIPEDRELGVARVVLLILLIPCTIVLFVAAFEAFAMVYYSAEVFSFLGEKTYGFFILTPFPTVLFYLGGAALQLYWVALVIIILVCAAYATILFIKAILQSDGLRSGLDAAENTAVFWITVFLSGMLLINVALVLIWMLFGNEATTPEFGDNLSQMFLFADAAVWEEIISRVLLIGVPMTIISLIVTKKKESLRCLLGGFGMSRSAIFFIIMSGVIFGIAHYSGWDGQAWKVIATSIMGIFFGYLFVRFGLYAAILMHFIVDYLSAFDWMEVGELGILVTIILLITGFFALIYLAIRSYSSKDAMTSLPNFKNKYIKT